MEGWISLHRKTVDWEWYSDPNTFRLFIHCLLKANHSGKKWRGINIERGSFVTSYSKLAEELELSVQKVRTAINNLKSTSEITSESNSKHTVIKVVKYNEHQCVNKQDNKQSTSNQQATNKQITTTNNNNNNNENKIKKEEKASNNPVKVKEILKRFDETNFENTQRVLKTSKEEIRKKLEEFLEVEQLTPTFRNKQIGEVLKHFRNWLNYNKPKEVRTKEKATWVGKCN